MVDVFESTDPLVRRIWGYLLERFPPVAYTVLVALFTGSAFGLVAAIGGRSPSTVHGVAAGGVTLLVFLHLRLMDEHKDFESDRVAYPERLLSRGVVSLSLLARLGVVAVIAEGLLAVFISRTAALAWGLCLFFTVLMRIEFGVGAWLSRHLVLYAITHNPIVGLLAYFLWVAAGGSVGAEMWLYIAIVSVGSLAFEVGRKVRLEAEEIPGVESYSSVLGKSGADTLLVVLRFLTGMGLLWLASMRGQPWIGAVAMMAQFVGCGVLKVTHRKAKVTEGIATLLLLLDFILIWMLAW